MKKSTIVQLITMLTTAIVCILGILVAFLSTAEDTALSQEQTQNLEFTPSDDSITQTDLSVDVLEHLDLVPTIEEEVFFEDIVDVEAEVEVETTPIQPTSHYTSNYEGALISFEPEDITYLDNYLWEFGEDVAVYFYDIHSKVEYVYNPDQKFSLASVIKAPYCMFVYELASLGRVDLEQVIAYEQRHLAAGTGDIKEEEFGTEYTVEELIGIAIKRSDNTAIEMLRDVAPLADFIEYVKVAYKLDHHEDISWGLNTATDVKDVGAYAVGVYEFIEVNPYGENLKEYMVNSRNKMIYLPHTVAHKYGWTVDAFNDLAIVYADNPYALVICSKRVDGTDDDYRMFSSIGNTINNLHTQKYQALV